MGDKLDTAKLILGNWKTIVSIFGLLASLLGWTITDNIDKTREIKATRAQVTNVANHLSQKVEPKKVEPSCAWCKSEIDKLKRWH